MNEAPLEKQTQHYICIFPKAYLGHILTKSIAMNYCETSNKMMKVLTLAKKKKLINNSNTSAIHTKFSFENYRSVTTLQKICLREGIKQKWRNF